MLKWGATEVDDALFYLARVVSLIIFDLSLSAEKAISRLQPNNSYANRGLNYPALPLLPTSWSRAPITGRSISGR